MKKDIFKTMIKAVFTIMAVICMATSVQASAAGDAIYKAIKNGDKSVDVSSFHMKPKQAMDEYFNVVSANPDLFYVDYHVDCKFDTQSGECKELICGYNTSDIKGARTKFDTAVNTAIASAKGLAAKYDQAKAVHDYMIENFDFSADGITAYDIATKGKGNCTAYTGFYKAAMDKLGIPCKVACSKDMGHEWNLVQIDGNWYNADITWDDPIGGSGIIYSNFLKSDNLIKMGGHFNWTVDGNITCTDTKYDKEG